MKTMIEKIAENRMNGVEFVISKELSEDMFYNALCNSLDYINGYGITLDYGLTSYKEAKELLVKNGSNSCFEDVIMQILRNGKTITFKDTECGQDDVKVTLEMIHENIKYVPQRFLIDYLQENDDAETGDVIIQSIIYKDIIFG